MKEYAGADVLAVRMQPNDASAETIRDYLVSLVAEVWREREGFSGKRPFGNSGWHSELGEALVRAEMIDGEWDFDEDDPSDRWLDTHDHDAADRLINLAIEALRSPR